MLSQGVSSCPDLCPCKLSLPSVRVQCQQFSGNPHCTKAMEAILADMRQGKFRVSKPLTFILTPTLRCNQQCLYCMANFEYFNVWTTDPTEEQVARLLPMYDDCISFSTVGGDTFALDDDRINMLYAPLLHRQAQKAVTTNLRGLTLERYKKFFVNTATMNSVNVSLPTLNPETYRQVNNGQDLDTILRNMRGIASSFPKHCMVNLCMVVLSMNVGEIPDMARFAASVGIRNLYLLPLFTWPLAKRGATYLDPFGESFNEGLYQQFKQGIIQVDAVVKEKGIQVRGMSAINSMFDARFARYRQEGK